MPPVAMIAVAAFGAISAGAAIAGAIGVTAFLGMSVATWAAIGAVGMLVSGLALAATMPKPKTPESAGQQLNMKLSADNALPVAYGRTATGGSIYYRDTSGRSNKTLAMLVALSVGGAIGGVSEVRANDYQLSLSGGFSGGKQTTIAAIGDTDSKSKMFKKNSLHFWHLNGADPQPQTFAQVSGLPIPADRASGVATAIIQADYDQEVFPQGLPKFTWVVNGQRVYDPRKDSTYPGGSGSHRINNPATWEWSQNPHLCALNWTLGRGSGGKKLFGIGAPPEEVDIPAFVAGANIADALGWTVGGVAQTTDDKFSVLGTLLQAGGAIPLVRGAQISVLTYTVKPSIYSIGINDVIGSASVMNTAPHRDRKNRITPTYREESQFWNLVPGEAVSAAQYVAEDSGEVRSSEINLPFVQKASQAHQLATYDLVNTREFLTFEITAKPKLLAVRVGDCVTVTLPDIAVNNQKCMVVQRDFDPNTFQVKLTLRSETDAKHAFALGQSQVAPPSPSLSTFDPSNPDGPGAGAWVISDTSVTIPATEEQIAEGMANTVSIPALVVSGANDDPTTDKVIFEWRQPLNIEAGPTAPSLEEQAEMGWLGSVEGHKGTLQAQIANVLPNTAYEVAVSYRTVLGIKSPRLILGPVVTGVERAGGVQDGGIDWNANTIINVPPVLTDLDPDGRLWANSIVTQAGEILADALETIEQGRITTETAISDLGAVVSDAANSITSIQDRVDGVWAVVGENDGEGLRQTVIDILENGTGNDGPGLTELTTRVTGLETTVNATGGQALARQTDLTELEAAIDGTYAKVSDVSAIQSAVSLKPNTFAQASAPSATGRITGDLWMDTDDNNQLYRWSGSAWVNAGDLRGESALAELVAARNGSTSLTAQLTTMRQTTTDGLAGKASVSDLTNLTSRVSTAEGDIGAVNDRVDTVETDLSGKASSTSVTNLTNTIATKPNTFAQAAAPSTTGRITGDLWMDTDDNNQLYRWSGSAWAAVHDLRGEAAVAELAAARNGSASLSAQLGTMRQTVTDGLAQKASATDLTNLTSEVTGARNGSANLNAQLSTMRQTVTDGLAGKASAQSVTDLQSSLNTKPQTFHQTTAPSTSGRIVGDLWADSDDNNQLYRWSGSAWVAMHDLRGESALAELVTARAGSANLNARITSVQSTLSDAINLKADASSVLTLQSSVNVRTRTFSQTSAPTNPIGGYPLVAGDIWFDTDDNFQQYRWSGSAWVTQHDLRGESAYNEVVAARGGTASLTARFTSVNQTITDGLAGKASTSSVTSLTSTVNGHTGQISTLQSTDANLQGQINTTYGVILNAGNKITGFQIGATQTSSYFDVMTDRFRVTDGSSTGVPFEIVGGVVKIKQASMGTVSAGNITVGTLTQAMTVGTSGSIVIDGANNRIVISD